jgi:hypothetical protein
MTASPGARRANGLPTEITRSLVSLWAQYAGKPPTNARTEIRGNIVTCVLVDAVGDFNQSMVASQTRDAVLGTGKLTRPPTSATPARRWCG